MKQQLYQVVVEQRDGLPLMVGPAQTAEFAERFAEAIRMEIRKGNETVWSNPTVLPANNLQGNM